MGCELCLQRTVYLPPTLVAALELKGADNWTVQLQPCVLPPPVTQARLRRVTCNCWQVNTPLAAYVSSEYVSNAVGCSTTSTCQLDCNSTSLEADCSNKDLLLQCSTSGLC